MWHYKCARVIVSGSWNTVQICGWSRVLCESCCGMYTLFSRCICKHVLPTNESSLFMFIITSIPYIVLKAFFQRWVWFCIKRHSAVQTSRTSPWLPRLVRLQYPCRPHRTEPFCSKFTTQLRIAECINVVTCFSTNAWISESPAIECSWRRESRSKYCHGRAAFWLNGHWYDISWHWHWHWNLKFCMHETIYYLRTIWPKPYGR